MNLLSKSIEKYQKYLETVSLSNMNHIIAFDQNEIDDERIRSSSKAYKKQKCFHNMQNEESKSFSASDRQLIIKKEYIIEMKKIDFNENKKSQEKISICHEDLLKENNDMKEIIKNLQNQNQELKNTIYIQKSEIKKLFNIIQNLRGKIKNLLEPEMHLDFIQEMMPEKFSKYFLDEKFDTNENTLFTKIPSIIDSFYKYWSFNKLIQTDLKFFTIKYFKSNEKKTKYSQYFTKNIINDSKFIITIEKIEFKSSEGKKKSLFLFIVFFVKILC